MRTSEQIISSFAGLKYKKVVSVVESEMHVYTIDEVKCMIDVAKRLAIQGL